MKTDYKEQAGLASVQSPAAENLHNERAFHPAVRVCGRQAVQRSALLPGLAGWGSVVCTSCGGKIQKENNVE